MAQLNVRRSSVLPLGLLLVGIGQLISFVTRPRSHPAFVGSSPTEHGRKRSRVQQHGFKDDFMAWREKLTDEERAIVSEQSQNEFDKKFRKTDTFKKDLPEEKVKEFTGILKKFFDSEAEDYKKEEKAKTPDYDGLKKKASKSKKQLKLRNSIVQINRNAQRRYMFAAQRIRQAEEKGEFFPPSSPLQWTYRIANSNDFEHSKAQAVIDGFKEALEKESDLKPEIKETMEKWIKQGIPPVGEPFKIKLPVAITEQMQWLGSQLKGILEGLEGDEKEEFRNEMMGELKAKIIVKRLNDYIGARDEVQERADNLKAFFRSQKERPGETKADIVKEIWAALEKSSDKPLPPLDEEALAELEKFPASTPEETNHIWGTADMLYKSEAIDPFGQKYLLGVYETPEEAKKAFQTWNAEYEKARVDLTDELKQWSKQEQARMDKDTVGQERIKDILSKAGGR